MNSRAIRDNSLQIATALGYAANPHLPLLDSERVTRTTSEIVGRFLAMHSTAAASFGFDRERALNWLNENGVSSALTPAERRFLESGAGMSNQFRYQIEGSWALCWSVQVVEKLDFGEKCANDFVARLPDLKSAEAPDEFSKSAALRDPCKIIAACDLAYCLHWAVRDSEVRKLPTSAAVPDYVIIERRRALEWLLTDDEWEDISLDT